MSTILFVADDTFDRPLPDWASSEFVQASSIHIITPVLGTRIERATDSDEPAIRSGERLRSVVASFEAAGLETTGEVIKDPPFEAVSRMLLDNTYDRIVIGVRADGHWKEDGLAERIREITDIPVDEVTLDGGATDDGD